MHVKYQKLRFTQNETRVTQYRKTFFTVITFIGHFLDII